MSLTSPNLGDVVPEITSIDCKILQYKYAIHKIQHFLPFLRKVQSLARPSGGGDGDATGSSSIDAGGVGTGRSGTGAATGAGTGSGGLKNFVLCHYLTLLCGNTFAINEGIFNSKLELISNYKLFRVPPINISPMVSHIPYDTNDVSINPLIELPSAPNSFKCCKILETLYTNCLQGYTKRLNSATEEIGDVSKYDALILEIFNDDIDLSGTDELLFEFDQDADLLDNNFVEATLIDIDIRMVFVVFKNYSKTLAHLKEQANSFKLLKSVNSTKQSSYLKSLPEWELSLHKIMLLTLRLNDLYMIIRKFGRKIYLSNTQHLNDPKFLSVTNSSYFKFTTLKSIDEIFNSTKKNGVLIANLTRLIRQNSKFQVNPKNVLDFSNFLNQGILGLETTLSKLDEFGTSWLNAEIKFRRNYNLSTTYLQKLLKEEQESKFPIIDEGYLDRSFKKLEISDKDKSVFNRTSRSSSVSSVSSNSSTTLARKGSINSVNSANRNSMIITSKTSPRQQRPNSMIFLNNNGSTGSLPKNINTPTTSNISNPPTTTRRRSNSQPQMSPDRVPSLSSPLNNKIASSGAATALRLKNGSPTPSKVINVNVSPSVKRQTSIRSSTSSSAPSIEPIKEEEIKIKKLSANQRLQNHLKEAARSGSLMTQEKEVLTSVVFDPNSPSSVNLRKHAESHAQAAAAASTRQPSPPKIEEPSTDIPAAPPKRRTRDQVTRLNTKRNSELIQIKSTTSSTEVNLAVNTVADSDLSTESETKRVRFTGVPAYTEAEDAPTKYSAKILKNFGVFKNPAKPTFKRKDQLLKKEESLSFKNQLHGGEQALLPNQATFLSNPLQNTRLKFKSKIP